jgi:hypothetical protein
VFDLGVAPLVSVLGFSARQPRDGSRGMLLFADAVSGSLTVPLLVAPWGAGLDSLWGAVALESARLECPGAVLQRQGTRLCDGRACAATPGRHRGCRRSPAAMALF